MKFHIKSAWLAKRFKYVISVTNTLHLFYLLYCRSDGVEFLKRQHKLNSCSKP